MSFGTMFRNSIWSHHLSIFPAWPKEAQQLAGVCHLSLRSMLVMSGVYVWNMSEMDQWCHSPQSSVTMGWPCPWPLTPGVANLPQTRTGLCWQAGLLCVDQLWVFPEHWWGAILENKNQKAPTCVSEKCHLLLCKGYALHGPRPKGHRASSEQDSQERPIMYQGSETGICLGFVLSHRSKLWRERSVCSAVDSGSFQV
jgi:hypothetical protein